MFSGLTGSEYDVYVIADGPNGAFNEPFVVSGQTLNVNVTNTAGTVFNPSGGTTGVNLVWTGTAAQYWNEFTNVTPSGGSINITVLPVTGGGAGDEYVSGFQLIPLTPVVTAGTFVWSGTGGTSWDTWTPNWSILTSSTYANGGAVIFADSGVNTNITITGSGVSPFSVQFTNNTTAYSFASSGGGITGSGSVALLGSGLVTFSNSNAYSGGTTISAWNAGGREQRRPRQRSGGRVHLRRAGIPECRAFHLPAHQWHGGGSIVLGNASIAKHEPYHQRHGRRRQLSAAPSRRATGTTERLTMSGNNSTLTLSGTNSYSGGTTVSAGTLASANPSALGTGPINLSGGALSVAGTQTYANAVNVTRANLVDQQRVGELRQPFPRQLVEQQRRRTAEFHRQHGPQRRDRHLQCPRGREHQSRRSGERRRDARDHHQDRKRLLDARAARAVRSRAAPASW